MIDAAKPFVTEISFSIMLIIGGIATLVILRHNLRSYLRKRIAAAQVAVSQFNTLLSAENGYYTNHQQCVWQKTFEVLFRELECKPYDNCSLPNADVLAIKTFLNFYTYAKKLRDTRNKSFVSTELDQHSSYFDVVEGRKLDNQQRTAIVTDEDNNLVIAGAGSGKTTTVVGKVQYVIDRYKIDPAKILLISFTEKSASTISTRIKTSGVAASTFHKFGKDVIAETEGKKPDVYDSKQFRPFLAQTFDDLAKNPAYVEDITTYFTDYMKPLRSQFEFSNQGDYIQFLKDQSIRPYKLFVANGTETVNREVVKSIEECKIANFLLFYGLSYEYEAPYERDTATPERRQYKPDFKVRQNGKTAYIEHLAVAKDKSVPPFFRKGEETQEQAKQRYWDKIEWARKIHKQHKTTLIETYSYEMFDKTITAQGRSSTRRHT